MKRYSIIVFLLGITLISAAQSSQNTKRAPDVYFTNVAGDFGTVKEGEKPIVIFTFFNSGDAPLLLKRVNPSCGCTVPEYPREPIMPGKSGEIRVAFDTKGYGNQKVHKSISITTNIQEDGADKVVIIYVKGQVTR